MIYDGLLITLKKLLLTSWKVNFYSCKETFITSGYLKVLLNQGYVVRDKYEFLCSRFSIATPDSPT